ncbi:MAG: hypothetical protein HY049_07620 [Acidobacteria bacterium]|nr:hypothetical protein [Acidobacteriota bacterium]
MTVRTRDLPAARVKRWAYHGVVALVTAGSVWSALSWRALAAGSDQRAGESRARVEADRVAADGVAAECGLRPFSDEVALRKFPMERPAFPTKRESSCLQKVTQTRGDLINDRIDLDRALPVAAENAGIARRRTMTAAALVVVLAAGLFLAEVRPALPRTPGRRPS